MLDLNGHQQSVTLRMGQTADVRTSSQGLVKRCFCGGHLNQEDSTFSVSFITVLGGSEWEEVVFSLVVRVKGGVHFLFKQCDVESCMGGCVYV